TLEIAQFGAPKQSIAVTIFKRKAHLQKISHHDLETTLTISGDNLDRIEFVRAGINLICRPIGDPVSTPIRNFDCPTELAANASFPDRVTIQYVDNEPAASEFPVSKIAARPHMISDGPNAITTRLSVTALQWNLSQTDQFVSEDSGLGLLLHAYGGYKLSHGSYQLQLKFSDDPKLDAAPDKNDPQLLSVPLMADLQHNELRTKKPITFDSVALPSVVNPIWYRVQQQPSGMTGDWQPLNRAIIYLPQLTSLTCASDTTLIHGAQLELVDWASAADPLKDESPKSTMTQCDKEQCLALNGIASSNKLKVKLHWIDNRVFDVSFPTAPNCAIDK
ncbi:MAG TPA: hypothetical protein VK832_21955, partial [Burkholderiaceae bacterium]|nr:hypothetical protein [Burkholderiaceae bacterium]